MFVYFLRNIISQSSKKKRGSSHGTLGGELLHSFLYAVVKLGTYCEVLRNKRQIHDNHLGDNKKDFWMIPMKASPLETTTNSMC